MTAAESRMRAALLSTRLYTGEDKVFQAETAAYGAGLALLFDGVETLRRDLFVVTATDAGLGRFERLFRRVETGASGAGKRREMLLRRFGVTLSDHTKPALESQLLAAGIRGNLVEHFEAGLYVNVHALLGVAAETAEKQAAAFLPAHLPAVFDFGQNMWDAVDARGMTFLQMDTAGCSWDEIDRM